MYLCVKSESTSGAVWQAGPARSISSPDGERLRFSSDACNPHLQRPLSFGLQEASTGQKRNRVSLESVRLRHRGADAPTAGMRGRAWYIQGSAELHDRAAACLKHHTFMAAPCTRRVCNVVRWLVVLRRYACSPDV